MMNCTYQISDRIFTRVNCLFQFEEGIKRDACSCHFLHLYTLTQQERLSYLMFFSQAELPHIPAPRILAPVEEHGPSTSEGISRATSVRVHSLACALENVTKKCLSLGISRCYFLNFN